MAHDEVVPVPQPTDGAATVHGWLRRCVPEPRLADDLLVEVLSRVQGRAPDCLRSAPPEVRLRHATVTVVLRSRGVLREARAGIPLSPAGDDGGRRRPA
ncbi:hypothetical protein SAMN05660464_3526 [Geodermatophilus dictyosporus]|uniref:Uncharacterized protein n=1 Tax=Geodermatophilus dictyosporus TaxID=1523247 RepID=A0A1I5RFZ6_9ACTN|nr:hypothetical protein [Geodermatophilus dictyosporus]SFP57442.1 hypothetical protein SAMN05660464_3526 [Geodermatophilus dictyosporus]